MNKGAVGKTGEKALKLHGTFRWIWINSLSSWVRFNMSTWKMERIHPLTSAVNVLILPLKRRLGRLIRGNLMRNLSRRSWPYLFFRHFYFAISTLTLLDGSSDPPRLFRRTQQNFELRAEVCLQLEPRMCAVIFIPGTCGSSDCSESSVGFAVGLFSKWAHICAAMSNQSSCKKRVGLGRSLEKIRGLGSLESVSFFF